VRRLDKYTETPFLAKTLTLASLLIGAKTWAAIAFEDTATGSVL